LIQRIKTGARVELSFKGGGETERRKLATVVEAVLGKKEVLVMMPISGGAMIKLPANRVMEARFYTESSLYLYDVTVTDHPIIDGIYLTKLQLESAGKKVQLRDYYRISSALKFNFSVVGEEPGEEGVKIYSAVTKDFSGGGMSFVSTLELEEGAEIYANLVLDSEYLVVLTKVRGRQKTDNPPRSYIYRCQFIAVPDSDQEKIIQYINNQQFKEITQTKTAENHRRG